jgi:hypothetical protein
LNVCLVHAYSRKIYSINLHLKIIYVRTVLVQKYIHFNRCTYYLRIPSDARRKELDWNLLFGPPTNLYWGQGRVRPRLGLPYIGSRTWNPETSHWNTIPLFSIQILQGKSATRNTYSDTLSEVFQSDRVKGINQVQHRYFLSKVRPILLVLSNAVILIFFSDGHTFFWRLLILNRYFSVHVLIVFKFFYILVDEKIKLKILACSFEITY